MFSSKKLFLRLFQFRKTNINYRSRNIDYDYILVGLGQIGFGYDFDFPQRALKANQSMSHCTAISRISNSSRSVIAIDPDTDRQKLAKDFFDFNTLNDIKELNSRIQPIMIIIATPTQSHKIIFESLARLSPDSCFLLEKPVGSNLSECLEISDIALLQNSRIYVNYFRRFLPATQKARSFIKGLDLGKLIEMKIQAYGSLINIFSHFVDLSLELTGSNLYCYCLKDRIISAKDIISSRCDRCSQYFTFTNIGKSKLPCYVNLDFENFTIRVADKEQSIEIVNKSTGKKDVFKNSQSDFLNYQSIVYEEISKATAATSEFNGLEQALLVHRFLESV